VKWNVVLFYLEIVLILMDDRCTVCAEHNIGSEIMLGTTDGTPTDVDRVETVSVHLEILLISTQVRCMVCAERIIGSEIILDASDCTPRRRGSSGSSF
jgi:hypothetical protein